MTHRSLKASLWVRSCCLTGATEEGGLNKRSIQSTTETRLTTNMYAGCVAASSARLAECLRAASFPDSYQEIKLLSGPLLKKF